MCAFHAGSYTSFFVRQCLNTFPVKLKKLYFAANWRLCQNVKYPEIKPGRKHSKKLLSDVCIHFRELKLTLHCSVWKLCLCGICEGILSSSPGLVVRNKMSSNENWREAFRATALWCVQSLNRVKSFFGLSSLISLFLCKLTKDIWERS